MYKKKRLTCLKFIIATNLNVTYPPYPSRNARIGNTSHQSSQLNLAFFARGINALIGIRCNDAKQLSTWSLPLFYRTVRRSGILSVEAAWSPGTKDIRVRGIRFAVRRVQRVLVTFGLMKARFFGESVL